MKVAFYLNNENNSAVDCTNILNSNPGIGGSEYSCVLISYLLSIRENGIEVFLLSHKPAKLPEGVLNISLGSYAKCLNYVSENSFDYLIVDYKYITHESVLKFKNISFIIWANNFIDPKDYVFFNKSANICRVVNVGLEQLDLYRDCLLYNKSDYIFNAFPSKIFDSNNLLPFSVRKNNVVYIGSIVYTKGFHILARSWKAVLKSVPDAQLFVIGSGQLYNRQELLGKWNIAKKEYEEMFMRYLVVDDKLLPSVHFLGVLGEEKNEVLSKSRVGVPNPSGLSETFGYTAVEMQAFGCLVTSKICPGYLDTVVDSANLLNNERFLARKIVRLLQQKDYNPDSTILNLKSKFGSDVIIAQWEKLFDSIKLNQAVNRNSKANMFYRMKFFKDFIRSIKLLFPILDLKLIPIEILYLKFFDRINRFYNKI